MTKDTAVPSKLVHTYLGNPSPALPFLLFYVFRLSDACHRTSAQNGWGGQGSIATALVIGVASDEEIKNDQNLQRVSTQPQHT